jgi:predicted nucleic acid-binding Zn ribbon protein
MLTPLRSILKSAAKSLGLERAAHAAFVEELWPEVAGPEIALHTHVTGLRGGTLLIDAEPGPWAQDLTVQRTRYVKEINRRLGEHVVDDIRFRQHAGKYGDR